MLGSGRCPGGGNGNPLQYSCLEKSMDRGAWWASLWGCKESNMTERAGTCACTHIHTHTHRMSSSEGNSRRLPWSSGKDSTAPVQGESSAGCTSLIPGQGTKVPQAMRCRIKTKKKKGKRGRVATQDLITMEWKINWTWRDSSLSPWLHGGHP